MCAPAIALAARERLKYFQSATVLLLCVNCGYFKHICLVVFFFWFFDNRPKCSTAAAARCACIMRTNCQSEWSGGGQRKSWPKTVTEMQIARADVKNVIIKSFLHKHTAHELTEVSAFVLIFFLPVLLNVHTAYTALRTQKYISFC